MTHSSGLATGPVQEPLDDVARSVTEHRFMVKCFCADGDSRHHRRHLEYFHQWHSILIARGLSSRLHGLADDIRIPVRDCLHIRKTYCNKIKNHPGTLIPRSADAAIRVDDVQSLLQLQPALSDEFTAGKMRDSYALQLFWWSNCLECFERAMLHEFMYLIPWTLQEEVMRSPRRERQECLLKALLAFQLLLHYFELSHMVC
jgi:hypothetical protein